MNKQERLSYRITEEVDKKIDEAVREHDKIRHRSDLGTKALKLYLQFLKQENSIKRDMKAAILALSEKMDLEQLEEIRRLEEFVKRYD